MKDSLQMLQAADLCDSRNPARVLACLLALAERAAVAAPHLPRLDWAGVKTTGGPIPEAAAPVAPSVPDASPKRPSLSITLCTHGNDANVVHSSLSDTATHLRRRQSSILLQNDVDELEKEREMLEKTRLEQNVQLERMQATDQSRIDSFQHEKERILLEKEQLRTALKKVEIDNAILRKKAEADHLLAMAEQHRAVTDATLELEKRLTATHQAELAELKSASETGLRERRKQIQSESEILEEERATQLQEALRRIAELEQTQDASTRDDIARIHHEARVQLAVECERIRLEANQRAIEQVRQQAEKATSDITRQVTEQFQVELAKMKEEFESDFVTKTKALQTATKERERILRDALNKELRKQEELGKSFDEEKALRETFESELNAVRDELERQSRTIREQQISEQSVREMQLTREFQGELQRMKNVLEQKLRSEEQQRLEEQRRIEAKHRSESDELARKYAELTKRQAELDAANSEECAALERTIESLQETVRKAEGEAQIRLAVVQERDRFLATIAELEQAKMTSDAAYEHRLRETNDELGEQRAALDKLRAELELELNAELKVIWSPDQGGRRDQELVALKESQEATLREYRAEIERLRTTNAIELQKYEARSRAEAEQRLRAEYESKLKALHSQLESEQRSVRHLKAEIAAARKSPADLVSLQQTIGEMVATHNRDVDALKAKFSLEMTKAVETLRAEYESQIATTETQQLIAGYEAKLEAERGARQRAEAALAQATATTQAPPPPLQGLVAPPPPPPSIMAPPPPPSSMPPPPPPPPASSSGAASSDFLLALRLKPSLKKFETAEPPAKVDSQAELLEAIRSRPKLKKACERVLPKTTSNIEKGSGHAGPAAAGGMFGMMNIAQIAAQKAAARKKRIAESNSNGLE